MKKISAWRAFRRDCKRRAFQRSGMKPWSKGYVEFKLHEIERILRAENFQPDALPKGYGFRLDERIVEYPWLFSRLPRGPGTLLDAGSVLNFEFLLDLPALREKKLHICTLAPEGECSWERGISYLFDDLRRLPYRDDWFDWVACVSTLEHVGMDNALIYTHDVADKQAQPRDYLSAVEELRRVLKPGGTLFLTFPYGRAANHGWLQIFDSSMVEKVVNTFRPTRQTAHYFLYEAEGWRSSSAEGAAHATFFDIHHAPDFDPDFASSARAVCCLELIK